MAYFLGHLVRHTLSSKNLFFPEHTVAISRGTTGTLSPVSRKDEAWRRVVNVAYKPTIVVVSEWIEFNAPPDTV